MEIYSVIFFRYIRSLHLNYSANNSIAMSMPAIAAVLAYITYSASGHPLLPAPLFSSLTLFNLLRIPLMFLRKSVQVDPLIPTMYLILFLNITMYSTNLQFYYGCGQCSWTTLWSIRSGVVRENSWSWWRSSFRHWSQKRDIHLGYSTAWSWGEELEQDQKTKQILFTVLLFEE